MFINSRYINSRCAEISSLTISLFSFSAENTLNIPGKVLTKINQKVGFRFITKFGEKGIINLGKLVPGVGAVIGGSIDFAETKAISKRAYKWFMEGDFSQEKKEEESVEITAEELDDTSQNETIDIPEDEVKPAES